MMNPKEEIISLENLSTGYRSNGKENIIVTRNISASLCAGELTCLLGRNGAGKSTLLKTLSGFIPPAGGAMRMNGRNLEDFPPLELARRVGVVLTDRPDMENMTAQDLVALGRSPYTGFWGRLSESDRRIVDEAMSLVRIENLKGRMVATLSDGELQKTMIAKALAQQTPVIFLDEPSAFLDFPSKVEIMMLLRKLAREENKTIFMSTHDLDIALKIADKVWLIDKEYGVSVGSPSQLARKGEIARYFNDGYVEYDEATNSFKIGG